MESVETYRYRLETLETEVNGLRTLMYQMLADLRKDVHAAVTPVGLELTEKRADDRRIAELLTSIAQRLSRIEDWIAADRDERPARQEALDARLAAIERRQRWQTLAPLVGFAVLAGAFAERLLLWLI